MQRDLAVGVGLEDAALGAQALADRLVAVELAVDDELDLAARVRHRLIAVAEADDREPGMAEEHARRRARPNGPPRRGRGDAASRARGRAVWARDCAGAGRLRIHTCRLPCQALRGFSGSRRASGAPRVRCRRSRAPASTSSVCWPIDGAGRVSTGALPSTLIGLAMLRTARPRESCPSRRMPAASSCGSCTRSSSRATCVKVTLCSSSALRQCA